MRQTSPPAICAVILCLLSLDLLAKDDKSGASQRREDPIVGRWRWFTNDWVFINGDGTVSRGRNTQGRWKCVDGAEWPRKYVITWGDGIWVDTLFLKKDCTKLSGRNQKGSRIHATKIPPGSKDP
jgi:hypothetical protein